MHLRGIDFGHVLNASGARNFDGSGWWYHRFSRWLGLDYANTTFVAKTTTFHARLGYMPLDTALQPLEMLPACIKVRWWHGFALNAVGLSGPGAEWLLKRGVWYEQERPFFVSFMSVAPTRSERTHELVKFVDLLSRHLPFKAPVGLQLNFSCPNVGLEPQHLVEEMHEALDIANILNIPLVPKISVTFPEDVILGLGDELYDALCLSNTIPWGQLPDRIDWRRLFGSEESPLARFGGGGLSGAPLLPLVVEKITRLRRRHNYQKPIIGCGGILSKKDADQMLDAGADAVELGSVSMLRPWRVRGIAQHVNNRLAP